MTTKYNESKLKKLPIFNRNDPAKKFTEAQEKHLREICTFEFNNLESAGQPMKFSYGTRSAKMDFEFQHGETYAVPRFIAKHVESCSKPLWKFKADGSGAIRKEGAGVDRRFAMREVY